MRSGRAGALGRGPDDPKVKVPFGRPATAPRLFRSNRDAGLMLFAAIALHGWAG